MCDVPPSISNFVKDISCQSLALFRFLRLLHALSAFFNPTVKTSSNFIFFLPDPTKLYQPWTWMKMPRVWNWDRSLSSSGENFFTQRARDRIILQIIKLSRLIFVTAILSAGRLPFLQPRGLKRFSICIQFRLKPLPISWIFWVERNGISGANYLVGILVLLRGCKKRKLNILPRTFPRVL